MAILKVARMGHPVLRKVALPVPEKNIQTQVFQQFIDDMIETMHEYVGLGLAAPQVHQSVRVCVVEIQSDPDSKKQPLDGLHVFINPEIEFLTKDRHSYWEGCLSVPGLRGLVPRPHKIRVKYLDRNAKKREVTVEGFLATVLQHEFDHLDGKLYIDRIEDTTKLVYDEEFEKHWTHDREEESEL